MEQADRWITILGSVGVIAGLVFLALEIQQSNRIAIAATEIEVRSAFSAINESVYSDPALVELLAKLTDANTELAFEEDLRVYAFVQRLLNTYLAVETAYENGMVPDETFNAMETDLRGLMTGLPGTKTYFARAYDGYPPAARTRVLKTVKAIIEDLDRQ